MAFTVGSLGAGLVYFKKGNRAMSQQMMRYRIGGQAFTFLAIAFYAMPASIATGSYKPRLKPVPAGMLTRVAGLQRPP